MDATTSSRLLSLPAELRNRIWHEVLLPQSNEHFCLSSARLEPGLLSVNRQVRLEATGIFYSNNVLLFSDPQLCVRLLTAIPRECIDLIPELRYDTSETCAETGSWRAAFGQLLALDQQVKMGKLKEELLENGIELRAEMLKCRVLMSHGPIWTNDPVNAALEAGKRGEQ